MNNLMEKIDITGLDKLKLLRYIWTKSKIAPFFIGNGVQCPDFDEKEAKESIYNGEIKYMCGRTIMCNFWGNYIDPWDYDEIHGEGALKVHVFNFIKENS